MWSPELSLIPPVLSSSAELWVGSLFSKFGILWSVFHYAHYILCLTSVYWILNERKVVAETPRSSTPVAMNKAEVPALSEFTSSAGRAAQSSAIEKVGPLVQKEE